MKPARNWKKIPQWLSGLMKKGKLQLFQKVEYLGSIWTIISFLDNSNVLICRKLPTNKVDDEIIQIKKVSINRLQEKDNG